MLDSIGEDTTKAATTLDQITVNSHLNRTM